MRTSKLLILGMALLVPSLAVQAEEPEAMPPAVAEAELGAPQGDRAAESAGIAPAEETPFEAALASEAMPAADADVPVQADAQAMPVAEAEAAAMPDADAAVMPATGSPADAVAETDGSMPVPAKPVPAVEEASRVQLGAIGYDAKGRPGRIHVVSRGDTLWFISDAYLGTPWVWPSIWQDNRDIENPHRIYPGDHIWITPSEMRKVTPEEVEALLAGMPAEEDPIEPAAQDLANVVIPGKAEPRVQAEQPKLRLSDREKVGLISTEELDAAAAILGNTSPPMLMVQADRIWIGLGVGDVAEGDQFTVLRVGSKVFDPETNRMLGRHVEFLGWLEVKEVDVEVSLAVVMESTDVMRKGDRLVPRRVPRSEIPLVSSPSGVEGQISYLPNSRTEMGSMDYVYLNRGTLDGVEVGSPLHVYRKGFKTRDHLSGARLQIPDRVVAELVVVRSQPEASVAFVRHTQEELARGDYFRGTE
jgi:hypothetical protein